MFVFYNHIIKLTEFIKFIFFPLKIISLSSIFLCWKNYDLANGVAQGQKLTYELDKKNNNNSVLAFLILC